MSKITVITPFYKGNQYLKRLTQMVKTNAENLKKEFPDCEVEFVIVNDCPEVAVDKSQAVEGAEYKIVNHEKNGGIHAARITGLDNSDGEYILFLDQDDEITDDCMAEQLKKIGDADVIVSNAYLEMEDKSLVKLYPSKYRLNKVKRLEIYTKTHNQIVSPGHCLIKREAIPTEWKTNVMQKNGADDLFLWVLMLSKNCKFVLNDEVVYTHKHTGSNLSSEGVKMSISTLEIIDFLNNIPYVSKKCISDLERSRVMQIKTAQSGKIKKLLTAAMYPDIILPAIWWKAQNYFRK
ncbi:MAG: glycosyltransferase family 2 protein [Oscillospiraceae bacterium]|nr:glycosyltransferase family 2 protein [Oscillospiraceae bacterium]